MKLHVDSTPVAVGGVVVEGEFRIKNSPKAFMILASGLYSNKFRAILRELGANAKDSHVAAGKADVPFTVHLPTKLNPVLSIKDEGLGLDHEGVTRLYTTYFESTKADSNDSTGCLGLGSKSPFSYTKNFTVTAVYNGVKRIYSAFINERGIPAIATMNGDGTPTDEPNGLEVSFAVESRDDMYQFANEAQQVYKWFRVKPKIIGNAVEIPDVKYVEKDIVPGVSLLNSCHSYNTRSYAIMGDMAYPIQLPEAEKMSERIRDLYRRNELAVQFEIGDLDIAASREELSYIPMTVDALIKRGKEIIDGLEAYIAREVSSCKTPFERLQALSRLKKNNSGLFGPGIEQYIKNNPSLLPANVSVNYYDVTMELKNEFIAPVVPDYRVTISHMRHSTRRGYFISSEGLATGQQQADRVHPETLCIVFHDTKGSAYNRLKAERAARNAASKSFADQYFVFHPNRKDMTPAEVEQQYKAMVEFFGNPPASHIMRTSQMADPKGLFAPKARELGVLKFEERRVSRYDTANRLIPSEADEISELAASLPDGRFLYIPVNNRTIIGPMNESYTADEFIRKMDVGRINEMLGFKTSEKVYGIRKTAIKLVKDNSDWVNFYDYIEEKFDEIDWTVAKDEATKSIIRKAIVADYVFQAGTTLNTLQADFQAYAKKDTPFGRLVKAYYESKPKGKVSEAEHYEGLLSTIHDLFPKKNLKKGIDLDLVQLRKTAAALVQDVKETYPLLKYVPLDREYQVSTQSWKDALQYVETVDNASK
jgi:hypothetical protein